MTDQRILMISGAIHENATSKLILDFFKDQTKVSEVNIFDISQLPFFVPGIDVDYLPEIVRKFHNEVESSTGIIFCSPEYVFSLPGVLKNSIEWLVSTTLLDCKKVGFVIAAASGQYAFESLDKILSTLQVEINEEVKLHLRGLKGKISTDGTIVDQELSKCLITYMRSYEKWLIEEKKTGL